jgi:uncharacterized cupin superfamily protein
MSGPPIVANINDTALEPEEFAPGAVIEGDPRMMGRELSVSPDERIYSGIWSVTPGKFHDLMEGDETFVVLAGRMTVEPEDGSGAFDVGPGDVCVFTTGYRSIWTVHQTIVKGYRIEMPSSASTEAAGSDERVCR